MAFKDMIPWRGRARGRRSDPFELMRGVIEPMERFFESPFSLGRAPSVDFEEKPEEFVVRARLPGLSREDLKIEVTDSTLTLRGAKTTAREQRRHGGLQRRESSRTFVRRFALPAPVKTERVTASFKGGELVILMPRVNETPVRRIDIE